MAHGGYKLGIIMATCLFVNIHPLVRVCDKLTFEEECNTLLF